MAGLESIAMAVHLLEQRERHDAFQSSTLACEAAAEVTSSPTPTPVPTRSNFADGPRRVSSDSVYDEHKRKSPSPTHSIESENSAAKSEPVSSMIEDMSPEMISLAVERLADDGEFQGPPPKPPPPDELITKVKELDVLCGRGGETNHHAGNVKYRSLVKKYQPLYIMSKRRDKPLIASKIVRLVRHSGGRFLRKDKNNTWRDVGNTKAREKTSQALREGAPELRSPQKDDKNKSKSEDENSSASGTAPDETQMSPSVGSGFPMFGGMPLYQDVPVIDNSREIDIKNGSPSKKMKLSNGVPMGGVPQFFGGSQHAYMHAMQPHVMQVSASSKEIALAAGPSTHLVSPHSFAATVSADDDESKGEEQQTSKPRGPRLKLLKKRLQEQVSEN